MIGRTIGKYRIVGQLGRGGAGIVYKAVDETLNRDVAVKTLNPDLVNSEVMNRFRAEATILAKLNHPQIATIYELFRSDNELLMVMEFVSGETLDRLCERSGAIEPDRAAYVIDSILSALEHAHRAGIVHRDVKPANVMVTEEGGIKIMDFGIARVLGAEQKTVDFRLMGTPAYMSPEQVMGQEVDGRTDLYSVGVLFYRLLTGALPFNADTALGMLQRQIRDTPTPISVHQPTLPEWCDQIVQRALAKTPSDRFQSAEEFRDALSRAAGPLPVAELAKTFITERQDVAATIVLGPPAAFEVSRRDAVVSAAGAVVPATAPTATPEPARFASAPAMMAIAAFIIIAVIVGALQNGASGTANAPAAAATSPAAPAEPLPPAPAASTEAAADADSDTVTTPSPTAADTVVEAAIPATPAPEPSVAAPGLRATVPPAKTLKETPRETRPSRVASDLPEASLVFETRAIVGTRKAKEQAAQLVLGEGKITIIPQSDPTRSLCAIPYTRVISVNVSRGRDPLWNSPQGPALVARTGGALSKLGIGGNRNWIAVRTSTEEQFVAMRFDEVILKRVLLALEERTGHTPEVVVLPEEEKEK
jgi:serine/threonine-protein kinase